MATRGYFLVFILHIIAISSLASIALSMELIASTVQVYVILGLILVTSVVLWAMQYNRNTGLVGSGVIFFAELINAGIIYGQQRGWSLLVLAVVATVGLVYCAASMSAKPARSRRWQRDQSSSQPAQDVPVLQPVPLEPYGERAGESQVMRGGRVSSSGPVNSAARAPSKRSGRSYASAGTTTRRASKKRSSDTSSRKAAATSKRSQRATKKSTTGNTKKTATKRSPGRPRKQAQKTATKRSPGRPRKQAQTTATKRSPGRPRKSSTERSSSTQ